MASRIVNTNALTQFRNDPIIIALWVQVIVRPEIINNNVLNTGIPVGWALIIPTDNQCIPNTIDGHRDEWKNAQKNPRKSIISDVIKSPNPLIKHFRIINVW